VALGAGTTHNSCVVVEAVTIFHQGTSPVSAAPNAKSQVREVLDRLPDDCTIEDVQYHLYVAEKIRRRIEKADAGQAVPHAEAEKRLEKWLIK
jgi:hypothetical protein